MALKLKLSTKTKGKLKPPTLMETLSVDTAPGMADYQAHLQTHPVTGMVSTSKTVSGTPVAESLAETQTLHPGVYTNGMEIRVEGGRVLNLGNYETARVGVTITVPCTKETLEEAYDYATNWISAKIDEAVKMAKEP